MIIANSPAAPFVFRVAFMQPENLRGAEDDRSINIMDLDADHLKSEGSVSVYWHCGDDDIVPFAGCRGVMIGEFAEKKYCSKFWWWCVDRDNESDLCAALYTFSGY